jgi:hypothetical protein
MGRPLSKQQFFGANELNNIKVQFFNGTASVPGFIVEQTGSKRFVCQDANGTRRTCYLVDKASADLAFREMTITLKYDDDTIVHATKIARHRFSAIDGKTFSAPWNFSTSTTDEVWQIEEAGTDDQLTDNTDLEGDDAPPFNLLTDYPVPGSGTIAGSGSLGLPGYNAVGSPGEPGGSILDAAASGYGLGLRRNKFTGNFCATASTAPEYWEYTWFIDNSSNVIAGAEVFDTFGGFGNQVDLEDQLGGHHFSLESRGWIKAPISQTYNFYGRSDDHMAIWIGNEAKTGYDSTNFVVGGHGSRIDTAKSVTLDAGKWYPIRIWFSEFGGNCQSQFFAVGSLAGGQFSSDAFSFKYNPQGEGW